ncbi:uncharacterized protein LOC143896003 isoform X1 [Temnothorax americanus]|uniref:uncharacterized protein LOC143896003 isoform X1 n=1 Tax=Temnothorax americanus TaxID=1964332 RepID=UPI0040698BD4
MSSKRKSAVENTCVREHLKRTKPGNSGKVKPAKTGIYLSQAPLVKTGTSKILPADKRGALANNLLNKPDSSIVQNNFSRSTLLNKRGLLNDKTNTLDLHANQQIQEKAFSVQGLPSGFLSTDIQENCSTIVINGQRLDLRKIPIIDDQQQVLNNIVPNNETESAEKFSDAEDVQDAEDSLRSDDGHYNTEDIEDGRSDEREDENVDGEYEHHDNNNYQNDNENEEFCAPHNNQNETQSLLDFEQLDHDIDHCCLSCREILLMLLKKVDQLLLIMKNGPQKNNNNNNPQNEQIAGTFDQLQMLPIKEVEQLLLFDQNLVNPLHRQIRSQFEAKMVAVGGDTFDKAIKRILSVIMTDELAGKCTWIIRKAGKTKISNCNFPKIISVYITKKYAIIDEIVKKRIQLWLQKYGDRIKLKEEQARKDEEHRQKEIEEERRLFNQA